MLLRLFDNCCKVTSKNQNTGDMTEKFMGIHNDSSTSQRAGVQNLGNKDHQDVPVKVIHCNIPKVTCLRHRIEINNLANGQLIDRKPDTFCLKTYSYITHKKIIYRKYNFSVFPFVLSVICLFGVFRLTGEFFNHMETSTLPVIGYTS